MITLGYVNKRLEVGQNLIEVRLPIFEQPGMPFSGGSASSIFRANICCSPGTVNVYDVGDCVVVGFLDNKMANPIILGKLYTASTPSEAPTNTTNSASLVVTDKAVLPMNTKIGNLSLGDLLQTMRQSNSNEDLINEENESGSGGFIDFINLG